MSPTTIQDLPPELLCQIFELGAIEFNSNGSWYREKARRPDFLSAVSLVCRAWRHPGQSTLWKRLELWIYDSCQFADKFVASDGTKRGLVTRHVCLAACSNDDAKVLMDAVHGVRKLEILQVDRFDGEILEAASLLDLQDLLLYEGPYTDPSRLKEYVFQFDLICLKMNFTFIPHTKPFLAALLSHSVTSIRYCIPQHLDLLPSVQAALPFMTAHAPNLTELAFLGIHQDVLKPELVHFFKNCTNVVRFLCHVRTSPLASVISGPVELWTIEYGYNEWSYFEELAAILGLGAGSIDGPAHLVHLKKVVVKIPQEELDDRGEMGKELIEVCKKRGIQLIWDGQIDRLPLA